MPGIFKFALFFCTLALVSGQMGPGGGPMGGPMGPMDQCMMQCFMNPVVMAAGTQENSTGLCTATSINSTEKLDATCTALKAVTNCTGSCPDSPMKKMMLVPLTSQQFMCGDRIADFKKNIPCLPNSCPKMESACQSKCGTVESSSSKLLQLLGVNQGPPGFPGRPGPNATPAPVKELSQAIAGVCTVLSCYMTCGEPMITKDCGKDAFMLQRDYSWYMFSDMVQSVSSFGKVTPWPKECDGLQGVSSTGSTGTPVVPVQPGNNSTMQTGTTTTRATKVCDQPACGAAVTIIPSIVLVLVAMFVAIRDL